MELPGSPLLVSSGTQRIGALCHLPALVRALGANPIPVLSAAGLAGNALEDPEARMPYVAFGALLREASRQTGCPHLGLLAGRVWHVSDLGLVGELVANSRTVGEALHTLTVYQHLNSGGGLAFLLKRGGIIDIGYAIYHPDVPGTEYIHDAVLAAGFNYLRDICGPGWLPSEVLVPHAKPADVGAYHRLFNAPIRFSAELCALRFAERWMTRAVDGFDPNRRRTAEERARELGRGQIVDQVFRALRLVMLHGKYCGDDVANVLAMHRRTLNRQLRAEGTTFQQVLDTVRFEVARQLLSDSDLALDDVAAALGYADVTPFTRTFRRWAGTTPGRWRRAAADDRRDRHDWFAASRRPHRIRARGR